MHSKRHDENARQAAARYQLVTDGLNTVFQTAVMQGDPRQPRTAALALKQGYQVGKVFLASERDMIAATLRSERDDAEAHVSATLRSKMTGSDLAAEHVDAIAQDLHHALTVQVERDVRALGTAVRQAGLRLTLTARAQRKTPARSLADFRSSAPQLNADTFTDRGGRRWNSKRYVSTLARHASVMAWNETAMIAMSEHGLDEAVINHPDPAHSARGMVISLTDDAEPSWGSVRDGIFHPNTEAWLGITH